MPDFFFFFGYPVMTKNPTYFKNSSCTSKKEKRFQSDPRPAKEKIKLSLTGNKKHWPSAGVSGLV